MSDHVLEDSETNTNNVLNDSAAIVLCNPKLTPEYIARNALDANIDEHIRALNQRRNVLVPISRLPTELLANIFVLVSDEDKGLSKCLPSVRHVCRSWKTISLNHVLLWTHIDCTRGSWCYEMTSCSGQCPLNLTVCKYQRRVSTCAVQ